MRRVVIKVSGHVFDDDELVIRYVKTFNFIISAIPDINMVVICGGGSLARRYVNIVRRCTSNEALCDIVGIGISRINAMTMALSVKNACPIIPRNVEEVLELASKYRVVFCGGFQPGQSTATVTMIVAEVCKCEDAILCSNIDAVYDKDPIKYPDAKRLEKITLSQLEEILSREVEARAGTYPLLDLWAIQIARRAKIRIYLIDCRHPEKIMDILLRGKGYGTLIVPD